VNDTFWNNKRVLVTGHTGFKGGWLSLWLDKLGAQVSGFALAPSTTPSFFELVKLDEHVQSIIGDIRDRDALVKLVAATKPDIVFHLAAQPLVRESYRDPLTTLETNVMGTAKLLDALNGCESVKAVVVVTSDKCYLNREWHWGYRENESLGGHDPYSASKACTELVAQSWQQSFCAADAHSSDGSNSDDVNSSGAGYQLATARAGNVIGGGDWSQDRLIPDVLASLNKGEPVVLRNPSAVRPWQHVLEPIAGYLLLAEKLFNEGHPFAQAWNFGPHDSDTQTVQWIVEHLIEEGGGQNGSQNSNQGSSQGSSQNNSQGSWINESEKQPHEAMLLKLDSSKARQMLGWNNAWTLTTCLQEIAQWNAQWLTGGDMNRYSMDTIERFIVASQQAKRG